LRRVVEGFAVLAHPIKMECSRRLTARDGA
jgi:hypothetical protein